LDLVGDLAETLILLLPPGAGDTITLLHVWDRKSSAVPAGVAGRPVVQDNYGRLAGDGPQEGLPSPKGT
jgi:hypothetical protein